MHVGPAEAVNRLVGVAHGEQLAGRQPGAAQQIDQFHLHRVGVLQFVDEQEAVTLAEAGADGGVIAQQVAGRRQQVLKIDDAMRPFSLPIGGDDLAGHAQRPPADFHRLAQVLRRGVEPFQLPAVQLVAQLFERRLD